MLLLWLLRLRWLGWVCLVWTWSRWILTIILPRLLYQTIYFIIFHCLWYSLKRISAWDRTLRSIDTAWHLLLKFILLFLLHHKLMSLELFDRIRINILIEVGWLTLRRLIVLRALLIVGWLFLDPEVLWWFEIIPENRDYFLDLVICICINEKICVFWCYAGLLHT